MHKRTYLRLRVAAFFAALGVGGVAVFIGGLWVAWSRTGGPVDGFVTAGLIGGFGLLGLVAWVGFLFDENVARPIMGLARELRARAASDVDAKIDQSHGRYLGQLAPAVDEIHEALSAARRKRDEAIAQHTARIEQDKAFLETLIRELSQAVLVISPAQRVLLFNEAAEALLGPISLDRPVGRYLEMAPLARHISGPSDAEVGSHRFLTSTLANTALVAGTLSEIRSGDRQFGFVLVCEAATDRIGTEAASDHRMATLLENVRRPAMNLGAMLEVLGLENLTPNSIHERMQDELHSLAGAVSRASGDLAGSPHNAWPRERISLAALMELAGHGEVPTTPEYAQCDAYFVSSLMGMLTDLIACDGDRSAPSWQGAPLDDQQVQLTLTWSGKALTQTALDGLLDQALFAPYTRFTSREALAAMDSSVWLCGGRCLRLELPRAPKRDAIGGMPQARQFFDLGPRTLGRPRLSDMSFVVFDTETTGLDPETDDVVQIAGVRILRSRIQVADEFDALVNPDRAIPPSSTQIHGITDAMVADAPHFVDVATEFAAYVDDSVLVAHNASFDRAFLDRLAGAGGPRITAPMLCTALIAQALDPQINDHTLDAVAERYGVEIDASKRHTALGDADTTARVFLKMLPLLEHRGLATTEDIVALQNSS